MCSWWLEKQLQLTDIYPLWLGNACDEQPLAQAAMPRTRSGSSRTWGGNQLRAAFRFLMPWCIYAASSLAV